MGPQLQREKQQEFLSKTIDGIRAFSSDYSSEYARELSEKFIESKFIQGNTSQDYFMQLALKITGAPRLTKEDRIKMISEIYRRLNSIKIGRRDLFLRDPVLLDFETGLRKFLANVLSKEHKRWQAKFIPKGVMKKLKTNKKKQITDGRPGKRLIDYASIGQLYEIMKYSPTWDVLSKYFPSQEWIKKYLYDELEVHVRSPLYHNHKIPDDYIQRRDIAISELRRRMVN